MPRITFAEMSKREAIVQKNVKPTIAVLAVHGVNAKGAIRDSENGGPNAAQLT